MTTVLDTAQLEEVTLGDSELMREIVSELVNDAAQRLQMLGLAVACGDHGDCARVAHSAKGACLSVGARALAELFLTIERRAGAGDLEACGGCLPQLSLELERLRRRMESL